MELLPARVPFALRLALAAASGGIYALAYPPLGWRWLVVPAVVVLLIALTGQSGWRARAIGFLHGLVVFAVGLSWLFGLFGGMAILLWIVLAIFPAAFAHFQGLASARGVKGWHLAAFTALNWGSWEFIRSELFWLKFPWLSVGSAVGPNGWLPWIGVYGVSALIVFGAALLSLKRWKSGAVACALVLAACLLARPHPAPRDDGPSAVKIGGVQLESVTIDDYLVAARTLPRDLQFVVWPEYAVPYDIQANAHDWPLVEKFCQERNVTLVFGTQRHEAGGEAWRNIALTVDPDGPRGEHNKVHPVHFFDDGIAGTVALPVETRYGKVGTPVCFDCDYEGVTRRMTAAGAEMFIVPVMDARSWTAREHDQHAELMRIRACENGRWMFVCATSGVSQVIDPNGMVHGRLGAMLDGVLVGSLRRETGITFYTRFGWLTPWVVLGMSGVSWILLLLPRSRAKEAQAVAV